MNKKLICIGVFFIIVLVSVSIYIYFNYPSLNNPTSHECYDCGEVGWELMDIKCDTKIINKEDVVKCLLKFDLYPLEINVSEIENENIKLNPYRVSPENNSIKVYKFHQWAIDEEGNMYLEGQLG